MGVNKLQSLFELFFIDIETVPQASVHGDLSDKAQKLFADKISKTMPEGIDPEDAFEKRAGILAEFARVVCISTGFFYKDTGDRICLRIKSIYGHDEAKLLHDFLHLTEKFKQTKPSFEFAGHNIREFDIPFLCRRMVINNIELPPYLQLYGAKPWEIKMCDTLQWWRFGDHKNYTSLDLLAYALGVPSSKDGMDGSMVQHVYYKDNDLERIAKYCQQDVIAVARIIQRFKNIPIIQDEQVIFAE